MKVRTLLLVLPVALFVGFAGCSSSDSSNGSVADGGGPDTGPASVNCTGTAPYDAWVSDPKMCVFTFAKGLGSVRQMAFAPNGDLFVNNGSVVALWDADGNGTSDANERSVFATAPRLGHGLAFPRDGRFVYASTDTTVYRWPYTPGLRQASGAAEVVIQGMPGGGSHHSRTLVFDSIGRLYVNVGSAENVDTANIGTRSQVRRFTIPDALPQGGIDYASGEVAADGMRNEVGLYIDAQDRLWGVENGRDNLTDPDFGGDIHTDNPGEEINVVDGNGSSFFGYPFCYSEYALPAGKGPGTEWADPSLPDALRKTDAWCADRNNVHPPAFVMPAHWAPLGIVRYTGNSLPFAGDFVIAVHGSWNRVPAVGRLLARAHVENGAIVSLDPIVGQKDGSGRLTQGTWDARPVDVRQGPDSALYFSDDEGGRVFKVGYGGAVDAGADAAKDGQASADCASDTGDDGVPVHLRCTGLYSDFANRTLAANVAPYTPGVELWSDGAEKQRFMYLPPGAKIDTRDMNEWTFPVGTKVWKEFRLGGSRVETRFFHKRGEFEWAWTTYRWTEGETDATRFDAGASNVVGNYEIPSHEACNKCHSGRKDKLLGFEAIALSLPTARGLTLDVLAKANALSAPPTKTTAALPEDATGKAAPALGALHMNCGVACHNENSGAGAHLGGLFMRLPAPEVLAGGVNVSSLDTWKTAANVTPQATTYAEQIRNGYKRILPRDASKSLVLHAMNVRGNGQMPPLATHQVDPSAVKAVTDWINAQP